MGRSVQEKIGQRIRARRQAIGLTQDELADRASTHRTYIGMLERAEKNVSVVTLARIASALEIELSKLLEGI